LASYQFPSCADAKAVSGPRGGGGRWGAPRLAAVGYGGTVLVLEFTLAAGVCR
jgi:hypothetical protein